MRHLLLLAALVCFAGICTATTWYVPDDFPKIMDAINSASVVNGDTVIVRPGTYSENVNFNGKNITLTSELGPSVTTIDGGSAYHAVMFSSGETSAAVLEGFTITNGFSDYGGGVYCAWSDPTIRDNVITGNTADWGGGGWALGAGIYIYSNAPTVTGNTITNNIAIDTDTGAAYGGGIYCEASTALISGNFISGNKCMTQNSGWALGGGIYCYNASPTIDGNAITENSVEDTASGFAYGGGIDCYFNCFPVISNNTISGNSCTVQAASWSLGGGIYLNDAHGSVTGNTITGNTVQDMAAGMAYGAGISCDGFATPDIEGNVITNNTCTTNGGWTVGGGIYSYSATPTLTSNVVSGNAADWGAGVELYFSDVTLVNNIIANNTGVTGGGIDCTTSSPVLVNNTITANSADWGGGMYCYESTPTIVNTIFWRDLAPNGKEIALTNATNPSTCTISYSDVDGGQTSCFVDTGCTLNWGAGMITADPAFGDPGHGDYHIKYTSPCMDAGDNAAPSLPAEDFEGDLRVFNATVDMGADEFHTRLYYLGSVVPGKMIGVRIAGFPSAPVLLGLGTTIQDPPQSTPYGELYLGFPVMQFNLGPIPASGILAYNARVPAIWNPGEEKPLQALVGPLGNPNSVLTNLLVLVVE